MSETRLLAVVRGDDGTIRGVTGDLYDSRNPSHIGCVTERRYMEFINSGARMAPNPMVQRPCALNGWETNRITLSMWG
ncbi:MAG: hypothetical protein LBB38_04660 [Puniceicoccales bacterium]|nr:hypothetical protein [Puniceicoccales bacterium]